MIWLGPAGTYSVGDYVYTASTSEKRPQLARIESAHPLHSSTGTIWLVRIRMRSGWCSGQIHRHIERALNPAEVARSRKLGLIPPVGEALR